MERDWTQKELARRSGFRIRTIQKAEYGGSLNRETICCIAEALSTSGGQVTWLELTFLKLEICERFIQSFFAIEIHAIEDQWGEQYSKNFGITIRDDKQATRLGGDFRFLDGIKRLFGELEKKVERCPCILRFADVLINQDETLAVATIRQPWTSKTNSKATTLQFVFRFEFAESQLKHVEIIFDTAMASMLFAK